MDRVTRYQKAIRRQELGVVTFTVPFDVARKRIQVFKRRIEEIIKEKERLRKF